jgi:hypothetical protein
MAMSRGKEYQETRSTWKIVIMRCWEDALGAVDNSPSYKFPTHLISRINIYLTLYTAYYVTQYDDDPDSFRRIISFLQLKDLLGDKAPDYVSHVVHFNTHPCTAVFDIVIASV